jgi:hypothetical protein
MNARTIERGQKILKGLKVGDVEESGANSLTFTITSGAPDRERDVVSPDGMISDNFAANPVMLWAHDYSGLPIARSVQLWKHHDGQRIKAKVQFVPDSAYHESYSGIRGSTVYKMYKTGFLNAVSIGFNPIEWEPIVEKDEYGLGLGATFGAKSGGTHFKQWELLEFSAVPVPSNPQALIDRAGNGYKKMLKTWARATIAACESCERDNDVFVVDSEDLLDELERVNQMLKDTVEDVRNPIEDEETLDAEIDRIRDEVIRKRSR